jgi:hypothetical protein
VPPTRASGPAAARVAEVPGTDADDLNAITLDPQGRVVAVGGARQGDVQRIVIARFGADGAPDAAFADGGVR